MGVVMEEPLFAHILVWDDQGLQPGVTSAAVALPGDDQETIKARTVSAARYCEVVGGYPVWDDGSPIVSEW